MIIPQFIWDNHFISVVCASSVAACRAEIVTIRIEACRSSGIARNCRIARPVVTVFIEACRSGGVAGSGAVLGPHLTRGISAGHPGRASGLVDAVAIP